MFLLTFALAKAVAISNIDAQRGGGPGISAHYSKYEYMIPMRDGVKLYASVYVPKDVPGKHPILMERTPYSAGPYGANVFGRVPISGKWHDAGYIFAYEDVRGKYMSEGDFVDIRPQLPSNHGPKDFDESTDTYDTVDYLIKHVPDNDGHVGLRGISYPGFYAEIGTVNNHPALVAASPQAPVSEWFMGDDWHHNGCLFMQDAFDFMSFFGPIRPKPTPRPAGIRMPERSSQSAYDFYLRTGAMPNFDKIYYQGRIPFWNEVLAHETYDDWWKARSVPSKLKNVHTALLFVGGFFDAEDCYGALNSYAASRKQNRRTPDYLVMGPWYHGMWARGGGNSLGDYDFGMPTSTWFQNDIEFPFFEKYLRMQKNIPAPAGATIFETGANKWRTFDQWPPRAAKPSEVFLTDQKGISLDSPGSDGEDSYENDPAKPTPYTENLALSRRPLTYPVADQKFAQERPDVLTFESAPLTSDITWAGPLTADLWVKCTGTDCDLIAKVIDVYPDDTVEKSPASSKSLAGAELLVRGNVMRAKFRDSFTNPSPLTPGEPSRVAFHMDDICHTFRKGHRLMIQIQSDWFPLVNRNPNVFTDINTAPDSAYQKATITILHGKKYPSGIRFGLLPDSGVDIAMAPPPR